MFTNYSILQKVKKEQKDAIKEYVSGEDAFVCLPTGYGKSLCFQSLPYVFDVLNDHTSPYSQIVVVSLLTSVMKDQIKALDDRRVKAVRSDSQQQLKDEILLSKYFSQVLKFCCKTRIGLTFKKMDCLPIVCWESLLTRHNVSRNVG